MSRAHTFLRYIRIAASAMCLVVCLGLIVLWVRSYWRMEMIMGSYGRAQNIHATSLRGRIGVSSFNAGTRIWDRWNVKTSHVVEGTKSEFKDGRGNPLRSILGFKWSSLSQPNRHPSDFNIVVPYWFPVAVTGTLGVMLLVSPSYRFSLRTLLIATTLIALICGAIAMM